MYQTDVDGVPTLVASNSGQTVAGLVFRVGRADETLARSGLTHLTEHLALHPLGLTDYHYNGSTGPVTTSFHIAGSGEDVAAFLSKVCDSLTELPMDRLETEKSIIRTEWSTRKNSVYQNMPLWRYGACGYGLLSYSEPGVVMITAEELDHWRRMWFTRENAVLWVAGEIPAGLRLRLPEGQRRAVPAPTSSLPQRPAHFPEEHNVVALQTLVRRGPAVPVYAEVLERNLFRDLRQEGGYSYSVATDIEPRGDGWTTVTAGVDALPEKLDAALGGFIDVLARLRAGRIESADMESYRAKRADVLRDPHAEAGVLPAAAFDLLVGEPPRNLEQRMADLDAVTIADVHAVAVQAWDEALLMVPEDRDASWAGFVTAPMESTEALAGNRIASKQTERLGLFITPQGVTRLYDDHPATVRYDQVAAMLVWPDGGRRLIGNDAVVVQIEPTLWELPEGAIGWLDMCVPAERHVRQPPRPADQIPQPRQAPPAAPTVPLVLAGGPAPSTPAPPPVKGRGVWSRGELVVLIGSLVVTTVICCLAGILTLAASQPSANPDDNVPWGIPIGSWVCTLVFAIPAVYVLIRRARRPKA
jgi:predicted Zn-dependent peptidase